MRGRPLEPGARLPPASPASGGPVLTCSLPALPPGVSLSPDSPPTRTPQGAHLNWASCTRPVSKPGGAHRPGRSSAHLWGDGYSAATADARPCEVTRWSRRSDLTSGSASGPSPPHTPNRPGRAAGEPGAPALPSPVTAVLGGFGGFFPPPRAPQLPWTHPAFMPSGSGVQEVSIRTQSGPGREDG